MNITESNDEVSKENNKISPNDTKENTTNSNESHESIVECFQRKLRKLNNNK